MQKFKFIVLELVKGKDKMVNTLGQSKLLGRLTPEKKKNTENRKEYSVED